MKLYDRYPEEISRVTRIFLDIEGGRPEVIEGVSLAYGGTQFGFYQDLGDGRSMVVADEDNEGVMILKGGFTTSWTRFGDGGYRSGYKEKAIECRLAACGIPTQRIELIRGTRKRHTALIWRPCPYRIGTIEYLDRHHPQLVPVVWNSLKKYIDPGITDSHLKDIVFKGHIRLAEAWGYVNFVHGCLNTDNICLLPCGIDYGHSYFVGEGEPNEEFDPFGRYSAANQLEAINFGLSILEDILERQGCFARSPHVFKQSGADEYVTVHPPSR